MILSGPVHTNPPVFVWKGDFSSGLAYRPHASIRWKRPPKTYLLKKRSPERRFLKTLFWCTRADGRKQGVLKTITPWCWILVNMHALMGAWPFSVVIAFSRGWAKPIKTRNVLTQKKTTQKTKKKNILFQTKRICVDGALASWMMIWL